MKKQHRELNDVQQPAMTPEEENELLREFEEMVMTPEEEKEFEDWLKSKDKDRSLMHAGMWRFDEEGNLKLWP